MSARIIANRPEVSSTFRVAGFTIRTGLNPSWFEVALATDPELFQPESKPRRTLNNFYSSRATGPLPAPRGEAVYLVPPTVLARFAGQPRLFYTVAVYRQPDFHDPEIMRLPPAAIPSLQISKSFTSNLRGLTGVPSPAGSLIGNGSGYTNGHQAALEWGGDLATPGEIVTVATPNNGTKSNGTASNGANGATSPVAVQASAAFAYDDGYGPFPTAPQRPRVAAALSDSLLYDVPLIPQPTKLSCWAASMAMLVSYQQQASVAPETLAQQVGRSLRSSYGWDMLQAVRDQFGFATIPLPSNASLYPSPAQWYEWLSAHGPLWVTTIGADSHAVVVRGIEGDLTEQGTTIYVLNPWNINVGFDNDPVDFNPPNDGLSYSQTFAEFAGDFGNLGLADYGNWRVLYLGNNTSMSQALGRQTRAMQMAKPLQASVRPSTPRARSFAGASFDVNIPDVQLVPQMTDMSCWAASAAMVVGWRDQVSIDPQEVARGAGRWAAYTAGLNPADVPTLAQTWGLRMEAPQSYTIDGLRQLLENNGPLWIGAAVPGLHAVVVHGIYGDGDVATTYVRIKDPWPVGQGAEYDLTLNEFIQEYEGAATGYPSVTIQVLHAGGRANPISATQGYSGARNGKASTRQPYTNGVQPAGQQRVRTMSNESFNINWNDVYLVPQPTNMSCWATAAAMIVGWREQMSFSPTYMAQLAGRTDAAGLYPVDNAAVAAAWGLTLEPPQSYSIDGFRQLLESVGPLWVGALTPLGAHAIVVTGMESDGNPDGSDTYVRVLDPWDRDPGVHGQPGPYLSTHNQGSAYTLTWDEFVHEYEARITTSNGAVNIQIMHAGGTNGRYIGLGSQAQSLGRQLSAARRTSSSTTARSMAAVEIASSIVGAAMSRILDNEGDVRWELDQLQGMKHPWNNPANAGAAAYSTTTLTVYGPKAATVVGLDEIYADSEISFQYNGHSLGNVQISTTRSNDAVGAGLAVKATIMDEANTFTKPPGTEHFAALKVRFHYRFDNALYGDLIAITDFTLYGDGTYDQRFRWTQN